MKKGIIISFGLALIIGVSVGVFTSRDKYYIMSYSSPEREITEGMYANLLDYQESEIKKEKVFNIQYSFISGVLALGLGIVVTGLKRKN